MYINERDSVIRTEDYIRGTPQVCRWVSNERDLREGHLIQTLPTQHEPLADILEFVVKFTIVYIFPYRPPLERRDACMTNNHIPTNDCLYMKYSSQRWPQSCMLSNVFLMVYFTRN
jgi:hypothetical protein